MARALADWPFAPAFQATALGRRLARRCLTLVSKGGGPRPLAARQQPRKKTLHSLASLVRCVKKRAARPSIARPADVCRYSTRVGNAGRTISAGKERRPCP